MDAAGSEVVFAVEQAPEGGFVARALGHSILTEADDLDALRDAVRDAVRCGQCRDGRAAGTHRFQCRQFQTNGAPDYGG